MKPEDFDNKSDDNKEDVIDDLDLASLCPATS